MKYITVLLILIAPMILLGQKRESTLLPMADVRIHNDKIIYLLSFDTHLPIVPVTYPQAYQIEYFDTSLPQSVVFDDRQSMLHYLDEVGLPDSSIDEMLLFLRAATLYKIWVGIGYISESVDLKPKLQQLSENANPEVSNLALKVLDLN